MIRPATPADVAAVARVQVASWEAVYRGLMPDAVIDSFAVESRTEQWTRFLAAERADRIALVADHDGEVVGMASLGASRDPSHDPVAVGELQAIYVAPDHWDHGHGRDLMDAAITWLRSRGFTEAFLWVLTGNTRARRFYEAAGWQPDGIRIEVLAGGSLEETRYRVRVGPVG
ncbi:MAG: hypothetical protein A2Z12_05975 [Actinobacteria bacterium RBG_16_68_21]|nr:MAG: hypothetical protein A2Z12_05975 [Actinobacteria bacterium RBG_16_68_21]